MRRSLRLLICAAAIAVSWPRDQVLPAPERPHVTFRPLREADGARIAPGLRVDGAWQMIGAVDGFGGYSGLVVRRDGTLFAISDQGGTLSFRDPSAGIAPVRLGELGGIRSPMKELNDAESVTNDPRSDRYWVGYEFRNSIVRFEPDDTSTGSANPDAMGHWWGNSGAEALARLPDGRFIVLAEMQMRNAHKGGAALLFDDDPAAGAKPLEFRFVPPRGYTASDMAALPDGRVLVLLRRLAWPLPPTFAVQLALADPADIRPGEAWPWHRLADLNGAAPTDNYEGLAVDPQPDGSLTLWLISDDNDVITQRTLLLKLRWQGWRTRKGAPSEPTRRSGDG